MGNVVSKIMNYVGKVFENVRQGSPRYKAWKFKWKNKKDMENYKMIRGVEYCEEEIEGLTSNIETVYL